MAHKLGIPYMGGKRQTASKIVDKMIEDNPNAKYFYDLFGGGGAISFELLSRGKTVHYNELNTGVVELLRKIKNEGVTPEFYKWVSREEFHAHKNDNTWYGGLLVSCWSFGNNQRSYIFGKLIEERKRLLHKFIVNRCEFSRDQFHGITGLFLDDALLVSEDIQTRRLAVMKVVKASIGRFNLEQLEQLQQLQQLQQLEQLERLTITNLSAYDVAINTPINETTVYLDPPYIDTETYQVKVCHDELYQYITKSPYKIYLSSYESHLPCVLEISHRSSLSAKNNSKKVTEKLFCNF